MRAEPASSAEIVVEVHNLEKHFGTFKAVAGISFAVRRGEIFGFLGPNGAGKSTTIRMLCGLLAPTAGSGRVAGFDIVSETEQIKTRIGYMSQKFSLYDELTVEENIDFYSGIYRLPKAQKAGRKEWVLTMAGMRDHRRARTAVLSGGWKQRLALGCAVLHEPPILFLDEPTSGVDPITRRQFWELIHQMADEGVTVFVTTHYMEEAEYCNRLGLIFRGKMVAVGTPSELKRDAMKGELLLIECEPLGKAVEALQSAPEVMDAAVFGNALHLVVRDADAAVPRMKKFLAEKDVAIGRIEKICPSLEDVFVSLTTASDAGEGRAA
jgi:ABC-2 type transport system ATP-binding protein